jgi:uncharacterized damage-inducible protein DinB
MARDLFLAVARDIFRRALRDLETAIEGCPEEGLNWKPGGDGTNSLAALTTHSLASTRSWLSTALGLSLPERDRAAEFRAQADPEGLSAYVTMMGTECLALLDHGSPVDWAARRETHTRPVREEEKPTAAWALMHALEHLREHTGQMLLTRQLWDQHPR